MGADFYPCDLGCLRSVSVLAGHDINGEKIMKDILETVGITAVTLTAIVCIIGLCSGASWAKIISVLGDLSMVGFVFFVVAILVALIAKLESKHLAKNQRAMMETIMGFNNKEKKS